MLHGRVFINVIPVLRNRIKQLEWESEIAEKALDEAYEKVDAIRTLLEVSDTPEVVVRSLRMILAS